jgi:cobalt/nickel transport system permease protein
MRSVIRALSHLHSRFIPGKGGPCNPAVRLLSALFFVLLLGLSRGLPYVAAAGTLFLLLLSTQRPAVISRVLAAGFSAAAFSAVLLLPSALWGNLPTALLITAKVFLAVSAIRLLSATTPWAALSLGLARLGLPPLLMSLLDLTVRYIDLLGRLSLSLLEALRLRSVGRNDAKTASLSGVGGVLFLRSHDMAMDVHAAMVCRCFSGRPASGGRPRITGNGIALLGADCLLAACFILLAVRLW